MVSQLLVLVGLLIDSVHGVFQLVDAIPHFEFVLKVLGFVAICAIVVFSAQSLVLLGLVDLVLELVLGVLPVLSEVGLHVPIVSEDVLLNLVL